MRIHFLFISAIILAAAPATAQLRGSTGTAGSKGALARANRHELGIKQLGPRVSASRERHELGAKANTGGMGGVASGAKASQARHELGAKANTGGMGGVASGAKASQARHELESKQAQPAEVSAAAPDLNEGF
jgi:hypothetical protein